MKITKVGYTLLATNFENQLAIMASNGQSGHIAIRIFEAGIDGGSMDWKEHGVRQIVFIPYGNLREQEAPAAIEKALKKAKVFDYDIPEILRAFKEMWNIS